MMNIYMYRLKILTTCLGQSFLHLSAPKCECVGRHIRKFSTFMCQDVTMLHANQFHKNSLSSAQKVPDVFFDKILKVCIQQRAGISRKDYEFPELLKEDLEISITKGSGPGGQSVNKSSNCVRIKHVPTGVNVRVHDTRSLHKNKEIALQRLQEKVDDHINGENSYRSQVAKLMAFKKRRNEFSAERRREMKRKFKETFLKEEENFQSDSCKNTSVTVVDEDR